jgi:hypothetical protein
MEPITAALAAQATAILTPYAKKGAEKFAEEVGKVASEKVKGLFNRLKYGEVPHFFKLLIKFYL